jgi:hypothetical protein
MPRLRWRFTARWRAGVTLLALSGADAMAQAPEYQGLNASIAVGGARALLDDRDDPWRVAGSLTIGYRFHLFDLGAASISLTPRFGLTATKVRGIRLDSREVAFSRIDVPGFQLAARIGPVRPYVLVDQGKVVVERYVGADLVNYWGSVWSQGFGVELPRANPCSAGFDLSIRRVRGTFTDSEWRGSGAPPDGGSVSATIITLGWSGRLRGSRVLFSCH